MTGEAFPANAEEHEGLKPPSRVAILNSGAQYADKIVKAVERHGIPADKLPLETPAHELESHYGAVIISGGPKSSYGDDAPLPDKSIWKSDLPVFGICYGMHAMVQAHKGKVEKNGIVQNSQVVTRVSSQDPLFAGLKPDFKALFTHGDFVKELPPGFLSIGSHKLSDKETVYSAIRFGKKVAVQFHPEIFEETPQGFELFSNFLYGEAGLEVDKEFQANRHDNIIEAQRRQILAQAAGRKIIGYVSGGVDSCVAAKLVAEIVAEDDFRAFYIDTGFMRDEDEMIIKAVNQAGLKVEKKVEAGHFEQALADITEPEEKRKAIGKAFVEVVDRIEEELGMKDALLLQGTNAADRVESGQSNAGNHTALIKTHHNVGPVQDRRQRGLVVEPLQDLFKDEVRELGRYLGLPDELVERHPFPGPGTAIRIITATEALDDSLVETEFALREFVSSRQYLERRLVQSYLLPIRSVGVNGDDRTYKSVVAIDDKLLGGHHLKALGADIPANLPEINRVIYSVGRKELHPPIITPTKLDAQARLQVRHADRIVFEEMRSHNLLKKISQFPVILLPLSFDKPGDRSVVLRPVSSPDYMTARALLPDLHLPPGFIEHISDRITDEVEGISQVFLDVTNKPPGTTEWE